ncbi:MAG: cation diffusion facilitator family transporter [Selenomonadaceae bacterium]
MTEVLIRRFIKDYETTTDSTVRERYGTLSGVVGICCNLLLFILKIVVGVFSGAISIVADAFNNLSDAGSSVVTILGFKLANRAPDEDHPFGHGRIEYLTGLGISVAIILVGVELLRTSVEKIFTPETVTIDFITIGILIFSIAVKFWLGRFYKNIGDRISSTAVQTAGMDSRNDCVATAVVLLNLILNYFTGWNIDGAAGLFVAAFILYSGVLAARDTIQPLLGQAPEPKFVKEIEDFVLTNEYVCGIHDLIVHDYGPGRMFLSLHAEISASMDIMKAHEAIDHLEYRLRERFHAETIVHMDPVVDDDPKVLAIRNKIDKVVKGVDARLSMHDFRLTRSYDGYNLIFDILLPNDVPLKAVEVRKKVNEAVRNMDIHYHTVIHIDKSYVRDAE